MEGEADREASSFGGGCQTSAQGRPKRSPPPLAGEADREASSFGGHGRPIVVIGGGWAGCAAAVELARLGHRVELHEASATLGGRARTVPRDGLPLDNGEHLLLGAHTQTIALAEALGAPGDAPPWQRRPLAIAPFAASPVDALSLAIPRLPGALGLIAGLASARGLSVGERGATLRWLAGLHWRGYACDDADSVADVLRPLPSRVREALWEPLCVAALNTPPDRASGQAFLHVLRQTFATGARATDIVMPREGLGEAIPSRAARWLAARGHAVHAATRTRVVASDDAGVTLEASGVAHRADAVLVAVGPHQLAATLAPNADARERKIAQALADVAGFTYEPIVTAYLGYDAPVPMKRGLLRLDDGPGQWVFDRADILRRASPSAARPALAALVSVVISASGPHAALDHPALVTALDAQLRRLAPRLPALRWSQVIEEKRATYACVPRLARPVFGRLASRVYLAGDYTHPTLPATLEAAVQSGQGAARALARDLPP
ncbi:MAG: hydroxysqualene dehydroxylase HpnE [Betaproteobacteria bacterium]